MPGQDGYLVHASEDSVVNISNIVLDEVWKAYSFEDDFLFEMQSNSTLILNNASFSNMDNHPFNSYINRIWLLYG
jgi:hypothetical protein